LLGGAIGLGVGAIAVVTLLLSLGDGEALPARALSGVFDLTILGANCGLVIGIVRDAPAWVRRRLESLRGR
jgi:hypothetical protein